MEELSLPQLSHQDPIPESKCGYDGESETSSPAHCHCASQNCRKVEVILEDFSKTMGQKQGNGGRPWVRRADRGQRPTCSAQKSVAKKPDPILMIKQCHEVTF